MSERSVASALLPCTERCVYAQSPVEACTCQCNGTFHGNLQRPVPMRDGVMFGEDTEVSQVTAGRPAAAADLTRRAFSTCEPAGGEESTGAAAKAGVTDGQMAAFPPVQPVSPSEAWHRLGSTQGGPTSAHSPDSTADDPAGHRLGSGEACGALDDPAAACAPAAGESLLAELTDLDRPTNHALLRKATNEQLLSALAAVLGAWGGEGRRVALRRELRRRGLTSDEIGRATPGDRQGAGSDPDQVALGASSLAADTTSVGSAPPSVKLFYSLSDLASRWRIHRSTVRRLIAKRELAAVQIGSQVRVPLAEVQRYERRRAIGGGA